MNIRGICPVCWRTISPTRWDRIAAHRDSVWRDICPASGEPFNITDHPTDAPSHARKAG